MQKSLNTLEPIKHHHANRHDAPSIPASPPPQESRFRRRHLLMLGSAAVLGVGIAVATMNERRSSGETGEAPARAHRESGPAVVRIVRPELRTMTFTVGQPGFVEAYEQTSIFSKVSGFIKKFAADIGDKVKEGQVLCEIVVPELEQEHQQKLAQVRLDNNMVQQAEELVNLAQAKINMASADKKEAEANVGMYQARVVRWESELKRMTQMVVDRVIDQQSLAETRKEFESSKSAWDAAQAAVTAREAAKLFAQAGLKKAKIDVETARAKVAVSEAEERRLAALLEYTKITSPYDGVVTVRNANTGDYVESVSGDKAASGHVPMFVVARTDLARIFVPVPEEYARSVEAGTKAVVCAEALSGQEIPATVTRTSWSLNPKNRSLLAEIDLPVKQHGIRPGMYVSAKVLVKRPAVRAVPQDALMVQGNQTYGFILENGRVVKTPVERGITDGTWEEVVRKKVGDSWHPLTGDEEFTVGDLSEMTDGQQVATARAKGE